jgi:hypothetical protein
MPEFTTRIAGFRLLCGRDLIQRYEMPVREQPPGYLRFFCRVCGCLVPEPDPKGEWMGLPAGIMDDDLLIEPERHIFTHQRADWYEIADDLPQLDARELAEFRAAARKRLP